MYRAYWNMESNPFTKEIDMKKIFKTTDFNEAKTRLSFLEKTRGIGLFTGYPGSGKTYTIKSYLEGLNSGLNRIVYIQLTTVSVLDFYRTLCIALGLETCGSKAVMFHNIQEHIRNIVVSQKKHLVITIDEAQLLKTDILQDLKILCNFEMDSKNLITLILMGLPVLNHVLSKHLLEDLKERIVMNYEFKGLNTTDIQEYILDRLKLVNIESEIFSTDAIKSLPNLVNGSIRKLNVLLERALILGAIEKVEIINSELIMKASNDISLV